MLIDGIKMYDSSNAENFNIKSGTSFPSSPNVGEMFLKIDDGLYIYNGTVWNAYGGMQIGGPLALKNAKVVRIAGEAMAAANTYDLYTAPAGKRCMVFPGTIFNSSASSSTVQTHIKVSGTYYRIVSSNVSAGSIPSAAGSMRVPIILEPGESIAVSITLGEGINARFIGFEFDDTTGFKTYKMLSVSSGYNVLYTVPTGKTASLGFANMPLTGSSTATTLGVAAGASSNPGSDLPVLFWNIVNDGGTPSASNRFGTMPSGAGCTPIAGAGTTLVAGESFQVNSDITVNPFLIWINVFEM